MHRYSVTLEYVGDNFHGWQKQPDKVTVQEVVEKSIKNISNTKTEVCVAGRTDAGVHAIGQVIHFDLEKYLKPEKLVMALNYHLKKETLGKEISFKSAVEVDKVFHARFSAINRSYRYRILNRFSPSALYRNRYWWITKELNLSIMKEGALSLLGTHDFTSFRSQGCQAKSPIKTINSIEIKKKGDFILLDISARSFLYNQVRIITGTLKELGEGKIKNSNFLEIICKKDRRSAGVTAPPQGLTLMSVDY